MNLQEKRLALEQRHRAAVRWEKLRAAYFTQIRNPIQAEECNMLARDHQQALDEVLGQADDDVASARRVLGWS